MAGMNSVQQMVWSRTGCFSCHFKQCISAYWKGDFHFVLWTFIAAFSSLSVIAVIYKQWLLSIGNSSVVQRNTEITAKPDCFAGFVAQMLTCRRTCRPANTRRCVSLAPGGDSKWLKMAQGTAHTQKFQCVRGLDAVGLLWTCTRYKRAIFFQASLPRLLLQLVREKDFSENLQKLSQCRCPNGWTLNRSLESVSLISFPSSIN